jgi:cysteine-rich repeat protein
MKVISLFCAGALLLLSGCVPPVCGDAEINAAGEECDDGDALDGGGCSAQCKLQTNISTDDVNGVNADNAFVDTIFGEAIFPGQDLDNDGAADDAQSVLNIVSANITNLCDVVTADPTFAAVDDIEVTSVLVVRTELDSAGTGFVGDITLQGDGDIFAGVFVGASYTVRAAGVEVASPLSDGLGSISLSRADTLSGEVADTLTNDSTTQTAITASFSANYVGATFCAGLFQ